MIDRGCTTERGIALIAVLLMLMLASAVVAGFVSVVMGESRLQVAEQGRSEAFYAAHGAVEKLTADLGLLFTSTYAPRAAQVTALAANPPAFPGVTFPTTSEGAGYGITFTPDANGNPSSSSRTISKEPYTGFMGLVTAYTLSATARTADGGESRIQRQVHTVGIPIFQFGIFSESDLAFEPGPTFTFSGRVHTNGNLFLGAASGPLTLTEKVTAFGQVVRAALSDGNSNTYSDNDWVRLTTSPGTYRSLRKNEGSVISGPTSAHNDPTWRNLSEGTYNGNIKNGRTGARRLVLPIATAATTIDLIRRPLGGESTSSLLYTERYFSKASIRILLSDTVTDITSLPGVTGTTPVLLGAATPTGYVQTAAAPPFALAPAPGTDVKVANGTPLLGGYLKIEKQLASGGWQDVTIEILNLGIAGPNQQITGCGMPSPNAVIRLQRFQDQATCQNAATMGAATSYWPLTLFDARQGKLVDVEPVTETQVQLGGVTHYIELDVHNLARWLRGEIGTTGGATLNNGGYTVYFSDRRGNRNAAGAETGEYGFEDFVNQSTGGTPNGTLDAGEDMNEDGVLHTYGATFNGGSFGWQTPFDGAARPWTKVSVNQAKKNPARFFRRALKLTNGVAPNIIAPGLAVVSENPVYVQGHYNAGPTSFNTTHSACSIITDAVTLLSGAWSDYGSFVQPYESRNRVPTETWYRMALMGGKGQFYATPPSSLAGSDGGVNNFIRYLEMWSGRTVHYRGSFVSLWYHRQAVYPFRAAYSSGNNNNTYFPPNRDYQFDTDFLQFNLLPPLTPMFRDVNVLGFTPVLTTPR